MNRIDIDSAYKTAMEIEGLILLIKERGDDSPTALFNHLKQRINEFCDNINNQIVDDIAVVDDAPTNYEIISEEYEINEPAESNDLIEVELTPDNAPTESIAQPIDDETILNPEADFEEIDDEPSEAAEQETEDDNIQSASSPLRVGDVIVPQGQSDLRKLFTLNDRFRFRRELFGNNDNEFADALNLVSAMNSFAEAEEYFYEDLGWNTSNEEVKEFIAIISRYFSSKN